MLQEHLYSDFKAGQFSGTMVHQIIPQIIAQYPKLKSLTIKKIGNNIATLEYDFEIDGKSTSTVVFSEKGKIKSIEFFDSLLSQAIQQEAPSKDLSPQKKITVEKTVKKDKGVDIIIKSLDGLDISAKVYEINKNAPVIILCHQAGYNKFEYNSIAINLNKKGFNCIAVDLRSGGEMNDANGKIYKNNTYINAKNLNKPTNFIDAEQDIVATINHTKKYKSPLILWGSSYSSALALYIAAENNLVDAVVAFSPGDYLAANKGSLVNVLPKLNKPAYITSSKNEIQSIEQLLAKTKLKANQIHFKPKKTGYHGSRALWLNQPYGKEYWKSINKFLKKMI